MLKKKKVNKKKKKLYLKKKIEGNFFGFFLGGGGRGVRNPLTPVLPILTGIADPETDFLAFFQLSQI